MKNRLIILSAILLLIISFSTQAAALKKTKDTQYIKIDGDFKDWKNKPSFIDYKQDIKSTWLNFLEVKYFADNDYLYLYIERQSANKSEPWDFKVIILNAEKESKHYENIPTEYRYYKKSNYYKPFKFQSKEYAEFYINSDYTYNISHKGIPVKITFEGEEIETALSAAKNNKIIEFRIPLEKVGLDETNKEVQFMLRSAYDVKAEKKGEYPYDWVPNGKPIIITTGSTYWQISSIIFFAAVAFIASNTLKKELV